MVAFQFTYSFPNIKNTRNTAFGLTATTGVTVQITNYDNVRDLNGPFQNVGINSPVIGVDAVHDNSMEFVGICAGVGPTAGGDFHINQTNTRTIGGEFMSLIKWLKGIFGR